MDVLAVQELEEIREYLRGPEPPDHLSRRLPVAERHEEPPCPDSWKWDYPQAGLCDDAEGPLAADEQVNKVVSGPVLGQRLSEAAHLSICEHDAKRHDPVLHRAVPHAPEPARPFGYGSSDGADVAARRVGGEEESGGPQLLVEVLEGYPRLHLYVPVHGVDLDNLVHGAHIQQDGSLQNRCAGQAAPCTPRQDREPGLACEADDARNLLFGPRPDDDGGRGLIVGHVVRVVLDGRTRGHHVLLPANLDEALEHSVFDPLLHPPRASLR